MRKIIRENKAVKNVKTVAELMAETSVQFQTGHSIKEMSEGIAEYLNLYKPELRQRARELGRGCGGRLLDETIIKYMTVTGKGVSKFDMQNILLIAECGRTDVNGYCSTFASSKDSESKAGCPMRVKRYRDNGLFHVEPIAMLSVLNQ